MSHRHFSLQLNSFFCETVTCLDNAMMEKFFGLMKSELLYPGKYTSMEVFIKDLKEYIEYYNNERIKLRLNGMSPVQYRKMLTASIV